MIRKIGFGSLIAGLFFGIFAGISGIMGVNNFWVGLTISKLIGEDRTESFATITSNETIQDILYSFVDDVSIFMIFFAIALVCIVIGLFTKNH